MPNADSRPETIPDEAGARAVLRHVAATLAYRAAKVLRDAPAGFSSREFGDSTRRPVSIVAHMGDLMEWGLSLARGAHVWKPGGSDRWDVEVQRFFDGLAALDRAFDGALPPGAAEKLVQGPLADALTHVGQLAMLRGMAGAPIRPESYARAEITRGRIGLDQTTPKAEFDGDASAR
jgi:hypothetical protein